MRDLNKVLENKKIDHDNLLKYGFKKINKKYVFEKEICDNSLKVIIEISSNKFSKVIDLFTNEEYFLVDVPGATGSFVGSAKQEYDGVINGFIKNCTSINIFKSDMAKQVINYIKDKYDDDLEYLWDRLPDCAIWRNKKNQKWYGILLKVKESSLGIDSSKMIDILNLKYQKDKVSEVIDNISIFPGYHMNKRSWISIKLDNISFEKVKELIDDSYKLNADNKRVDELSEKVYEYLTKIPKGKVVTYKQIAEYLGNKGLSRIVGTILHNNKDGDKYPCYKVLNSKGELAEAFVFGGKDKQKEKLEKDGIKVENYKVDLKIYKWEE